MVDRLFAKTKLGPFMIQAAEFVVNCRLDVMVADWV